MYKIIIMATVFLCMAVSAMATIKASNNEAIIEAEGQIVYIMLDKTSTGVLMVAY